MEALRGGAIAQVLELQLRRAHDLNSQVHAYVETLAGQGKGPAYMIEGETTYDAGCSVARRCSEYSAKRSDEMEVPGLYVHLRDATMPQRAPNQAGLNTNFYDVPEIARRLEMAQLYATRTSTIWKAAQLMS